MVDAIAQRCPQRVGAGDEPGGSRAGRASGSSRCRRWASRPTTRDVDARRARGCGAAVRGPGERGEERLRAHRPQRERGRRCCAGDSTASRSRSSSRRRGCGRCRPRISSPASISGSSSSPGAAAPRSNVTRRCAARSTGPTTCSTRPNATRWTACRCSRAAATSPRPRRSSPATTSTSFDVDDVLGQLVDKSLVVADTDDDGGVRYRLLETHPPVRRRNDSRRAGTRPRFDAATPTTTSSWPRRPGRTCGAESSSSGPRVVARDTDNFRAALDWAVETPSPDHALRLVAPLAVQGRIGERRDGLGRDRDARSPAATITRSFPRSPPGPRGARRWAAISSGPRTSSPSRNEPKRRSAHGFRPWPGVGRLSRSS